MTVGVGPILFGYVSDRIFKARKPVVVFSVIAQTLLWIVFLLTIDRFGAFRTVSI